MKFGGTIRQSDIDKHFDFEGVSYVFRVALCAVGVIGVLHVSVDTWSWLYPKAASNVGKFVQVTQVDRSADASFVVGKVSNTIKSVGETVVNVQNTVANAYSGVLENVSNTVVPEEINITKTKAVPPVPERAVTQSVTPIPSVIPSIKVEVAEAKVVKKPQDINNATGTPAVSAEAYLVADMKTGQILLEKNSGAQYQIASISKLVTALTADKVFGSSDDIYISEEAVKTVSDAGNIKAGEVFSAKDLLYPMLLESSNDAAVAYAMQYDLKHGDGAFVKEMMDLSNRIGMHKTTLVEPSGLSARNLSTAKDLFELAKHISNHDPRIFSITKIVSLEMASSTKIGHHILKNNNIFSKRFDFVGGKTGKTDTAKETMLSVFRNPLIKAGESGRSDNIVIIVLKSADREADTEMLYKWYTEMYK